MRLRLTCGRWAFALLALNEKAAERRHIEMGGILDKVGVWIGFIVFVLPVGVLWGITLIGITLMTARELWLGRGRRRRKHHRCKDTPSCN